MTQQEREIATIKPRQFSLRLSDADIERFYRTAYMNGTTPAEVLEGFIMDLVGGTYTHGSDEREYADRYFERCCYDVCMEHTFLSWALSDGRIDELADVLETLQYAKEDLQYYADHPAEAAADLTADLKETQADAERELSEIYRLYTDEMEKQGEPAQTLEKGIETVEAYITELETMQK